MLIKFLRIVALVGGLPFAACAGSLVSLKSTVIESETAVAHAREILGHTFAIEHQPVPLGELRGQNIPGLGPEFSPVAGAALEGEFFVVASDPAGAPVLWRYSAKKIWERRAAPPAKILGAAQAVGQSHVLFVSSSKTGILEIYGYHTITDTWASFGTWPTQSDVEHVFGWGNGFIVTTRNAAGGHTNTQLELTTAKRGLLVVDYIVIIIYLGVVAGIGLYFYLTGKKDTANFFVAGRKIPWWAAGLSLYATGTSAISYIAIPAKSYATNWLYLAQNVITFVGSIYVAFVIVPLVRRLNLMSVYEYLEMRFHPAVRLMASFICIVQHLAGRMSIVLLLPALALSAVTGISVATSILIMGVITTIYTVLGGMKAVIWTDVLQVFVMIGGAIFAMTWLIRGAGGLANVTRIALADHKTHMFDWSFDFSIPNVWTFLLILVVGTLTWPQDQVMTQRILSTKDDKAARGSLFMLTAIALPGSFMFFSLGTLLYAFYKVNPGGLNPLLTTDQTFPQFIAAELPPGVTGLIIAGVFAASMATLSSNINSIATLVSVDFYERYAKKPTPAKSVLLAEWTTVVTGILGTGLALYLSTLDVKSLWDKFIELMALFGGGFAGIYALGMFTRRANWQGCIIGIIASVVLTVLTKLYTQIHVLMYVVISIGACMIFGYMGSLLFPASTKSLQGLTIYDRFKEPITLDPASARSH